MFQWYHKNFKQYERLIFGIFLTIIVVSFVASGISGGPVEPTGNKDLAVDTPGAKFTRMEFDNLIFRWKHADLDRGSMFLAFLMEHGQKLYAGDFRMNAMMYAYGGDTRELDRKIGVDICVLLGAAKQADIRATDQEIIQKVKDSLVADGGFDDNKYNERLKKMDMEAEAYEKSVGEYILVDKYLTMLESGVSVATEDVFNEFFKTGGRAKAKYVMFEDQKFRDQAKSRVSQKAVIDMLRIKKDAFGYAKAPLARLEFLRISYAPLLATIAAPTDDEMKAYYDGHKSEFPVPTCALPPPESLFLPSTMVLPHEHSEKEDQPPDAAADTRYTRFDQVKYRIVDKVKLTKAETIAAETMDKVWARKFEMEMQGDAKPDFKALATEFKLEDPGSSPWFEKEESKAVDEALGVPRAGSPGWYSFFDAKVEKARAVRVRTDKASLIVRLIEKSDSNAYLYTGQMRHKAVADCAIRDASIVAKKAVDKFVQEFKDRFTKAYGEKIKGGAAPPNEELIALRFDTFTTLCAEQKLTVKETDFITRGDQIADVPDDRAFLQALFEIEARGEVQAAYGNSGQYLVELAEKRPPKADDFMAKRGQIQKSLLSDRQATFVSNALAEYKADKSCKIAADLQTKELK